MPVCSRAFTVTLVGMTKCVGSPKNLRMEKVWPNRTLPHQEPNHRTRHEGNAPGHRSASMPVSLPVAEAPAPPDPTPPPRLLDRLRAEIPPSALFDSHRGDVCRLGAAFHSLSRQASSAGLGSGRRDGFPHLSCRRKERGCGDAESSEVRYPF